MGIDEDLAKIGYMHNACESEFSRRRRFHQGWYRAFILNLPMGLHPVKKEANKGIRSCNTINIEEHNNANFITKEIVDCVEEEVRNKDKRQNGGIIEENRLFTNLLSSQPLSFNVFGQFYKTPNELLPVIKKYVDVDRIVEIHFEYAPNYSLDCSSYDVSFICYKANKKILLGIECKYVDKFSTSFLKKKDLVKRKKQRKEYERVFLNSDIFKEDFNNYTNPKYVQLFRNDIMAQYYKQKKIFDIVYTGVLYDSDDEIKHIINKYKSMIINQGNSFIVIEYSSLIKDYEELIHKSEKYSSWLNKLKERYFSLEKSEYYYKEYLKINKCLL